MVTHYKSNTTASRENIVYKVYIYLMYEHISLFCKGSHSTATDQLIDSRPTDVYDDHYSQHLLDVYSILHTYAGTTVAFALRLLFGGVWTMILTFLLLIGFELFENTPFAILRGNNAIYNKDNDGYILDQKTGTRMVMKNKKDGKDYSIKLTGTTTTLYLVSDPSVSINVLLRDYISYGVTLYRGDSWLNFIGDVLCGTVSAGAFLLLCRIHPIFGFALHFVLTIVVAKFVPHVLANIYDVFIKLIKCKEL
ncbi:hypothetical protein YASMINEVIRUS_499 [Yasminevirus sp. GU-2018]|uniref:Uncharacterized protein n=1 Tax=Yasminevirus sp. GU-2018 TaxID=2420051 RepID=A0A5K0UAB6_9VIRU|nr:hypothetical protein YASMINEVIRUS_499 [Yasminevirus sp. GU-2018]